MRYPVIGLSGSSGSGKTTLLEKILPLFVGMGFTVNVIKSSHHDVELEPPRKDSARIRKAGAAEVILASPYRFMLAHELKDGKEPTLDELISRMKPADLTLVEGFRDAAIPRIENDLIEVVASDEARPEKLPRPVEWIDLNNEKQVVDWMLNRRTT